MGGATDGVAGAEQAVDGHHAVVAPLVLIGSIVLRPTRPCARTGGVRAHDVRLGRRQLGVGVFGIDILRCPDNGLPDRHAEEVLPADRLFVRILEGFLGDHADRAAASLELFEERVVSEAGRYRMPVNVVPDQFLGVVVPGGLVFIAVGVFGVGLQMQEVGTDRTVTVLEAGQNDAVLHLRHLGADQNRQRVRRGAAPRRIPCPAHALTNRARLVDVRRAAGGDDHGLGAEHVEITRADIETNGAGNPVGLGLVHQQVRHHDAVVNFGGGLARGLGDDRLVAFAVNHDLPLAFAQIAPGFRVFHDRQAPLLELVHRGVDMPGDVVAQVLAHEAHEVVASVADMVFGLVLIPLHAHVAVDRVQALGDRAAALDIRFFDADDIQVAAPIPGFVSGAATGHAAADNEHIGIYKMVFLRENRPIRRLPA